MATEHGSLYAFNADTGAQLWQISRMGSGEAPSDDHGCNQISPEIGITSTPVIDRAKGNRTAAAKLLAIGRNTLGRKLKEYGLGDG